MVRRITESAVRRTLLLMSPDPDPGARRSLARRRALLGAALGFVELEWRVPVPSVATTLTRWMSSWAGVGAVIDGMRAQGYRFHLTTIDDATWRATFSRELLLATDGFGADRTPWGAVHRAAWTALTKAE